MALKLIVVGLRRSGTTIFWRTLRQDRRFVGYDEPFNPLLEVLPTRGILKHDREFIELLEQDGSGFWERFVPIHHTQELKPGLGDDQRRYLDYLAASGEEVMMDVTRCAFKMRALAEAAPDAVVVHLWRPAPSHATSHMLPSSPSTLGKLRKARYRKDFWTRTDRFGFWRLEQVIGQRRFSLFADRLEEVGLNPDVIYGLPAVGKLLAFWRVNFERAERDGRQAFGDRFISQNFEEFCREPESALQRIYEVLGRPSPAFDYSRIHPANQPHEPDSPNWERYLETVGLVPRRAGEPG